MLQPSFLTPRPSWLPAALGAIGRHQYLTVRQVAALVESPVAEVVPVLDGLVAERLLVRLRPTSAITGREPDAAYALARGGARLLAASSGRSAPRVPNARKSLYLLAHELARNELGVVLECLDRDRVLRVLCWETARAKIADVVQVVDRGRVVRVPLVADALAVVDIGGKPSALLVEVDMGTVAIPRMRLKYAGYLAWWKAGGPLRRFGLRSLRVLTIAPNESRLARLREAAMEATEGRSGGLFWFGEHANVDTERPGRLLDAAWATTSARGGASRGLFAGVSTPNSGRLRE